MGMSNGPFGRPAGLHTAEMRPVWPIRDRWRVELIEERILMAEAEDKKSAGGHTLQDHLYGENLVHEHDEYSDHDHDHFEFDNDGPLEENPIWLQDHVTLVSVGIDIGSAGTQVIFSRINLRRYGEDLTSRYYVVSRETLYQSPNALTPYQ